MSQALLGISQPEPWLLGHIRPGCLLDSSYLSEAAGALGKGSAASECTEPSLQHQKGFLLLLGKAEEGGGGQRNPPDLSCIDRGRSRVPSHTHSWALLLPTATRARAPLRPLPLALSPTGPPAATAAGWLSSPGAAGRPPEQPAAAAASPGFPGQPRVPAAGRQEGH